MSNSFFLEQQKTNFWCWCAVAVSVERYFNPTSQWTQETFAEKATGKALPGSDEPYYLFKALQLLGRLNPEGANQLSFEEIRSQLDSNLPVGIHIAWTGGGSHYVLITGYQVSPGGSQQVVVSDPLLPDSNAELWDFDVFVSTYRPDYAGYSEGSWADTCLVKQ